MFYRLPVAKCHMPLPVATASGRCHCHLLLPARNYAKFDKMETYGLPYDMDSIMHYGATDFAQNPNNPSIVPLANQLPRKMGQTNGLSVLDVAKLQVAYKCQLANAVFQDRLGQNSDLSCYRFSSDLPALRLLSLEFKLHNVEAFTSSMRKYLKRLHCGCEFEWFRQWWSRNWQLLRWASEGEIYRIPDSCMIEPIRKEAVYLPIDCAAANFPTGSKSIDHNQSEFSINVAHYSEKGERCGYDESSETFFHFSTEPMTFAQYQLQQPG
ncbi:uncharacterized protein LOC129600577 [Paramacrobiotus metropolitanus]|uniref:uncharacterized protein LOC129600577 n=1 Tax=Paramacrobiotus metropolitanus TaxID=2943436 RepID=UPI002445D2BC|nr:uncharacterized protein LOC129600577 [Paramacrobiotus metropolitanus]